MGVFAPLTGVIGPAQAMEAIKLLTGVGESLNGKLQVIDAKSAEGRSVRVKKDPGCTAKDNQGRPGRRIRPPTRSENTVAHAVQRQQIPHGSWRVAPYHGTRRQ
jgi:hypothetical protein